MTNDFGGSFGSQGATSSFLTAADIGNRACQHCGVPRLDTTLGFNELSQRAEEIGFVYDKLRRAELRDNVWRFATRRAAIRPIDTDTMMLAPARWDSATTYFTGSIVIDDNGYLWISRVPSNLDNEPGDDSTAWEPYFGPLTVSLYDSAQSYFSGELVYIAPGDGTANVYMSLVSDNAISPTDADAWVSTVTYFQNQIVVRSSTPYMSTVNLNTGNDPLTDAVNWTATFVGGGNLQWLQIGGDLFPAGVTLTRPVTYWPISSGPVEQAQTRNAYRLPANYLRIAPQDPQAGAVSYLGFPSYATANDWTFDGNYIISQMAGVIVFRFVADVVDVTQFDDMFCEALGARIAEAVVQALTQSTEKLKAIQSVHEHYLGRGKLANGIEIGPTEPELDDYVACRA